MGRRWLLLRRRIMSLTMLALAVETGSALRVLEEGVPWWICWCLALLRFLSRLLF